MIKIGGLQRLVKGLREAVPEIVNNPFAAVKSRFNAFPDRLEKFATSGIGRWMRLDRPKGQILLLFLYPFTGLHPTVNTGCRNRL